jgi:hypothetical protein
MWCAVECWTNVGILSLKHLRTTGCKSEEWHTRMQEVAWRLEEVPKLLIFSSANVRILVTSSALCLWWMHEIQGPVSESFNNIFLEYFD